MPVGAERLVHLRRSIFVGGLGRGTVLLVLGLAVGGVRIIRRVAGLLLRDLAVGGQQLVHRVALVLGAVTQLLEDLRRVDRQQAHPARRILQAVLPRRVHLVDARQVAPDAHRLQPLAAGLVFLSQPARFRHQGLDPVLVAESLLVVRQQVGPGGGVDRVAAVPLLLEQLDVLDLLVEGLAPLGHEELALLLEVADPLAHLLKRLVLGTQLQRPVDQLLRRVEVPRLQCPDRLLLQHVRRRKLILLLLSRHRLWGPGRRGRRHQHDARANPDDRPRRRTHQVLGQAGAAGRRTHFLTAKCHGLGSQKGRVWGVGHGGRPVPG